MIYSFYAFYIIFAKFLISLLSKIKTKKVSFLTKLCPFSALNIVEVIAVLSQVFGVSGVEGKSVTASFKFGDTIVALPVFITGDMVRVEAEVIGTFEALLSDRCKDKIRLEFVGECILIEKSTYYLVIESCGSYNLADIVSLRNFEYQFLCIIYERFGLHFETQYV